MTANPEASRTVEQWRLSLETCPPSSEPWRLLLESEKFILKLKLEAVEDNRKAEKQLV
jgi:hypothetical protein